jgi:polyribonucleotide nucleotidyltransferase
LSDIPFHGPVGAVRIGLIDGAFIVNPTYAERAKSLLNIMVVGTKDGIVMVESGSKECSEVEVVDAIEFAHVEIKKICAAIEDLVIARGQDEARAGSGRDRSGVSGRTEGEAWSAVEGCAGHAEASRSSRATRW